MVCRGLDIISQKDEIEEGRLDVGGHRFHHLNVSYLVIGLSEEVTNVTATCDMKAFSLDCTKWRIISP